ncbi:GntR family transcriptional regulator [Luteimonas fraxinea]|uniref:GntR family transcriptional regulator n=1 Tax=Luteimonas fraxinea TaxID=2901869 RepID=A0ABS8U9B8_9GAMM|nr:GntR family transcriptional regulator [Luteimonas fraxinea]MCD9095366.1 GntR family transcriptional regulator [Luteimonas fraxinea]UHH11420.1 GntR family transcriptional regulator [Luteimonas fraxinea]
MNAIHTKSTFLYERIRRAIQEGRYQPGQHVEPLTLAREFRTSVTPVRYALHRLAGAGLVELHARGGFHVPLPFEAALRDRYDWMEILLLEAVDRTAAAHLAAESLPPLDPQDLPKSTWKLFDAIAKAVEFEELHEAVKRTNDQLAPIRRAKQSLIGNAHDELAELYSHWAARDLTSLKAGVRAFHQRRIAMVPKIVSHLSQKRDALH